MKILESSFLQSCCLGRKNRFNSYSLPVVRRMQARLESHLATTNVTAKHGKLKTYEPAHAHFSKRIPRTQKNNEDSAVIKLKTPPEHLSGAEKELDLSEIKQASFEGFKKCYGAKDGDTNYNTRYDYDNNGVIDMVDWLEFGKEMQKSFQQFKSAFGSHAGLGNYISKYDYDGNGVIDMVDWLEFGKNWTA